MRIFKHGARHHLLAQARTTASRRAADGGVARYGAEAGKTARHHGGRGLARNRQHAERMAASTHQARRGIRASPHLPCRASPLILAARRKRRWRDVTATLSLRHRMLFLYRAAARASRL